MAARHRLIHPFDGWPDTRLIGNGWRINANHLTAKRAEVVRFVWNLCTLCGVVSGVMLFASSDMREIAIVGLVLSGGLAALIKNLCLKNTVIDMVPGTLVMKNGAWSDSYDLSYPHQFDMIPNPERVALEFRNRDSKGRPVQSFLDRSFIIQFHHFGAPRIITEIYDETNAREFVARLQAVDTMLQIQGLGQKRGNRPGD